MYSYVHRKKTGRIHPKLVSEREFKMRENEGFFTFHSPLNLLHHEKRMYLH